VSDVVKAATPESAGETDSAPSPDLKKLLPNTRWEWSMGQSVVFRPDGTIGNADWESRGLVTRWQILDHRTVLVVIEKGRDSNRYAILTFDKPATSYSVFGFENAEQMLGKHRLN
jgi:hypothetical protein